MTTTGKSQLVSALAAAAVVAAAFLLFWWKGAFLPDDIRWEERTLTWCGYDVQLQNRCLNVFRDGKKSWASEWDWSVQNCVCADIDRDGSEELLLLVWKRGSYGPHMPFWVKRNDHDLKQHIYIYRNAPERESGLRAAWMSSEIAVGIREMSTDGERVVIEDDTGTFSVWEWDDFGLKQLASDAGHVHFMACGDQLLHGSVIAQGMLQDDYSYLYSGIRDVIGRADLASLNQETPLVMDKALVSDYPRFGSPVKVADAVSDLGIDIVSTANNHALDQGMYGIDATISAYEQLGIIPVGTHASSDPAKDAASAVRFLSKNGITVALLGFTYGTNGLVSTEHPLSVERFTDEDRLQKALHYARENADAVIVFAHWGTEYAQEMDLEQERITALLLSQKADVVIGTHPHVVQPYEVLRGEDGHEMLVYYSLGNLISAQKPENCRRGAVASFDLVKTGRNRVCIVRPDLLDIYTENNSVLWGKPKNR